MRRLLQSKKKSLGNPAIFGWTVDRYSPLQRSRGDRTNAEIRGVAMKRIFSALVASVALLSAGMGAAHADTNQKCEGPASYCSVFFGN
jgi:hypothetical protein